MEYFEHLPYAVAKYPNHIIGKFALERDMDEFLKNRNEHEYVRLRYSVSINGYEVCLKGQASRINSEDRSSRTL